MLSKKVIGYLKGSEWWFDESTEHYKTALASIGIKVDSDIALFFLHAEDGPTFCGALGEMYHLCWFITNTNYALDIDAYHQELNIPEEYIPLDSFEGERGRFYNRLTGDVVDVTLGSPLNAFLAGNLKPQWANFNAFLEDFFGL